MLNNEEWKELINTGIILSSYTEMDLILDRVVDDSIRIIGCEGATIYIKKGNHLEFMISKNIIIDKKIGGFENNVKKFTVPISNESIAGYVALNNEPLIISDVYDIPSNKPYKFLKVFDEMYQYRTKSMLTLPMNDNDNNVIGVLQLINLKDKNNNIIEFDERSMFVARYLSSIAGSVLKTTIYNSLLRNSYLEAIERLAIASEFRDLETSAHVKRISEYSAVFGELLGFDRERIINLKYASQMHDIGKIGIPDRILQKPGPLTVDERKIMEKHTIIGYKIFEGATSDVMKLSAIIALTHHEKWDGTGYPNGLKGKDIPIEGRVVAIADVFDALVSKRVYKPAFDISKVISIMKEEKGKHFDPELLNLFFKNINRVVSIYDKYRE
ncbi:MAG TPA: HD domain-containing phosphohydrolase [Spirochaetota bacterium]|nr:HD domain-containing phosphohydrolase [Spirochaetota bacterium]HOM38899.1 HD domain-containing phosphohydrolase [Spirochaetota bacterium]HPQ49122.1 HD domain-containing phosphohydrolase [Spirochaetota bacterium]